MDKTEETPRVPDPEGQAHPPAGRAISSKRATSSSSKATRHRTTSWRSRASRNSPPIWSTKSRRSTGCRACSSRQAHRGDCPSDAGKKVEVTDQGENRNDLGRAGRQDRVPNQLNVKAKEEGQRSPLRERRCCSASPRRALQTPAPSFSAAVVPGDPPRVLTRSRRQRQDRSVGRPEGRTSLSAG